MLSENRTTNCSGTMIARGLNTIFRGPCSCTLNLLPEVIIRATSFTLDISEMLNFCEGNPESRRAKWSYAAAVQWTAAATAGASAFGCGRARRGPRSATCAFSSPEAAGYLDWIPFESLRRPSRSTGARGTGWIPRWWAGRWRSAGPGARGAGPSALESNDPSRWKSPRRGGWISAGRWTSRRSKMLGRLSEASGSRRMTSGRDDMKSETSFPPSPHWSRQRCNGRQCPESGSGARGKAPSKKDWDIWTGLLVLLHNDSWPKNEVASA